VPIQLAHLLKDGNAKARRAISTLTSEVTELQEENKKLLDQLVAAGFRNDELAQALKADQAVTPERLVHTHS
jgi:FtsZ-binding cell division protein ZapB